MKSEESPHLSVTGPVPVKQEPGVSTSKSLNGQLRLSDFVSKKYPLTSSRAQLITRQIGIYIAVDMRPLSVVESLEFQNTIHTLNPRYDVPSRRHFSDKVIPTLYNETVDKVRGKLSVSQ